MKKQTLLIGLVVILLLSNLSMIGFLLMHDGPPFNRPKPEQIIREKLHLDEEQLMLLAGLRAEHHQAILKADSEIDRLKSELYKELLNAENTSSKDSLMLAINRVQLQIEQIHFGHFLKIKGMLHPNQALAYKELTKELSSLFRSQIPGGKH